ncbi:MAG TPA: PadR family transcriptional regulator [Tepidisphaeraceae bacterium]|nr:PadR family transcriptional regulator [Tepidisphaeraceae bacterium]
MTRPASAFDHDLYSGLIRLHVLHHAARDDLYGNWMIRELRHHGYEISPGTLYPMLHALERRGYLSASRQVSAGRVRRVYRITPAGRAALRGARKKVKELFHELLED